MPRLAGLTFRPAIEADLLDCHRIWRDAIDAYQSRMGFQPLPEDNPGARRLHRHALDTDPERFMVAERRGHGGERRVVAFGSAVERGDLWFLSMLFVEPGEQAHGVGTALLQRMLPADPARHALATCTDSAQPISNGLYATFGIVPRMPLFNLVGRPESGFAWSALPDGVQGERVEEPERWSESAELAVLDRALLGFTHPQDHRFVQAEPRHAFAYRDSGGGLVGYGYAGEIGRIGPIGVSDPRLLVPVLGHLLASVQPRGASAVWLPGAAGEVLTTAIRAGLRIEGFPVLIGWSRPFADYTRYVPMSPGLI
ncbi:MAG: GNAT family N-acetyltransferase [Chloroflexota bacterium]|nr:GNAT family N-acetyltransferase [Chloroflexota bacterium]